MNTQPLSHEQLKTMSVTADPLTPWGFLTIVGGVVIIGGLAAVVITLIGLPDGTHSVTTFWIAAAIFLVGLALSAVGGLWGRRIYTGVALASGLTATQANQLADLADAEGGE